MPPADPLAATRKWRERDRRRRGVVAVTVEVHTSRVDELRAVAAQMQEAKDDVAIEVRD